MCLGCVCYGLWALESDHVSLCVVLMKFASSVFFRELEYKSAARQWKFRGGWERDRLLLPSRTNAGRHQTWHSTQRSKNFTQNPETQRVIERNPVNHLQLMNKTHYYKERMIFYCFVSVVYQRSSWTRFRPEDSPFLVWRKRFCPERWRKNFIKNTEMNPSLAS